MAEKYTERIVEPKAIIALFRKPVATFQFLLVSTCQLLPTKLPGIRLTLR